MALPKTAQTIPARTARSEALAMRVRTAAHDAIASLHAARDDRDRVHAAEWGQSERDTLGDIDVVADALHGIAGWVLSATTHPDQLDVVSRLEKLAPVIRFDLHAKLLGHRPKCEKLWEYVGRLDELREALLAYFEEIGRIPPRSNIPA
jgi:hypothetical protein